MDGAPKTNPASAETIFHEVLALSPQDRASFLMSACGENSQLYQRVTALLQAHDAPAGFLPEEPGSGPARPPWYSSGLPCMEQPGDKIGRYKLLQRIGEGGCGVVYMAEQEEPVRRRVALKIIKLGMDTQEVVARFEAERQALALMDHANIARVLDAGATETGRPFFVMELVRGIKITDYCDQHNVSARERVELMVLVCQAIQHAHQKGVIHRDIKPSNVLVSLQDAVAVPKVIDFGIAKATQGRLTDHTVFTAYDQFIGTPAYMSPEQAEMSGLDIDTRSDVYSLGVLLYELLTGRPPFEGKDLMAGGLGEVRDRIREKEPTRPSTMLSTMVAGDLARVANARGTEPFKLISLIRGDLEWIAMKCLEKDRTRRYETASGLAADLRRYLNNEPIVARPPSRFYLFRKFVSRHRVLFGSVSAVAAALCLGLGLSTWSLLREKEALRRALAAELSEEQSRQKAEISRREAESNEIKARTEASKSRQIAGLLQAMLRGIDPSVALGRDTTVLREILDRAASQVTRNLQNEPDVAAELFSTIGAVYLELGKNEPAEKVLRRALALRMQLLGEDNLGVAQSYHDLAPALWGQGKLAEAEKFERRALALRTKFLGADHLDVAASLRSLGNILVDGQKLGEATECFNRALAIRRQRCGEEHLQVAESLTDVGNVLTAQGKWEEAEGIYRKALALDRKVLGDQNPTVAQALQSLAQLLMNYDKLDEAEALARETLALRSRLFGEDHPLVADTRTTLATVFYSQGNLAEAEAQARVALLVQNEHKDVIPGLSRSLTLLVELLLPQGRVTELDALFNTALLGADWNAPSGLAVLESRALFEARTGRWIDAAQIYNHLIEARPTDHELYHALAPLLVHIGDQAGYRALCEQIRIHFGATTNDAAIADRMGKDLLILPASGPGLAVGARLADVAFTIGEGYRGEPWFHLCKALAEYRQGNFDGAVGCSRQALAKAGDIPSRDVEAYMVLAMAEQQLNRPAEAQTAWHKGIETMKNNPPDFGTGSLGRHGWIDWLIGEALIKEAEDLLRFSDSDQ